MAWVPSGWRSGRKPMTTSVPAPPPPVDDFIANYAEYADVLEAPREVHEAVAISLLAAVLNPHVKIEYGGLSLSLDLWTLVLSGSGFGRNTLVSLAHPILDASRQSTLVRGATWGSGPALYEDIAKHSAGLFIWPEMSQMLKTLQQSQFMGAKQWLTDRYDNNRVPETVKYRTGQPNSTAPIVFSEAPRLNILATSSMEWLVANLEREDTTGGFLPRWFIIHVAAPSRIIPKPQKPNVGAVGPLANHLDRVVALTGVANLNRIEDLYDGWYRQARLRFEAQPNSSLAVPFFNRLRALVLKLAVIFEVSTSCTLAVSADSMQRAIRQADAIEQTVFGLLPTGMTPEGFAIDRVEQAIRKAGISGITQSELTRAFQNTGKQKDRAERIETLIEGGRVCRFQRGTGGRRAGIFVHCDFAAQHKQEFPNDTTP